MRSPTRFERDVRREADAAEPRATPEPLERLLGFFTESVWGEDRPRTGPKAHFYRLCRIVHLAGRGFIQDECVFRASALTYITVLSLVPLLAFSFSVAKGFGFYQQLVQDTVNPFLDRTFGTLAPALPEAPSAGGTHEVRVALAHLLEIVGSVVQETRVTSLGAFGLVILGWAVIKLLGTIEHSFNHIWGVQRQRSLLRKVSDYLTMVIVTPIFLFTAAAVTTAAQDSGFVEMLRGKLHVGVLLDLLVTLLPLLSLWIGFTFVYLAMPNARTRLVSAIVGALVGGTLWWLTLRLHVQFQIGVARYSAIYSSFAAIPIFLIWVNISWVTVLLGAEVCFAHQSEPSYLRVAASRPADHAFKELLALRAMARIGERFLAGGDPWKPTDLAAAISVPVRSLEEVLAVLVERGLVVAVPSGKEDVLLPARDLDAITVKSVVDALKGTSGPVDVPASTSVDREIDRILASRNREAERSKNNITLRTLALAAPHDGAEAEDEEDAERSAELRPRTG
ncbi:MAG TPA: YhjD/YihY/BrkB family envelope integrity protein [Planctomycetota bacterium]|jgi:membrane protein|nr:YhjD/YihY/BrkB family envelope integrity protein [Planctomycetota bacterium]